MAKFRVEGSETSPDREQATAVEAEAGHGSEGGRGQALGELGEKEEEKGADGMDELKTTE